MISQIGQETAANSLVILPTGSMANIAAHTCHFVPLRVRATSFLPVTCSVILPSLARLLVLALSIDRCDGAKWQVRF